MLMAKLVLWNDIDWCSVWVIDIHGCGVKSQPVAHRAWCPVLFISFNLSSGGYYTTFGVVEQSIRFSEHGGGKNFAATALRAFSIAAAHAARLEALESTPVLLACAVTNLAPPRFVAEYAGALGGDVFSPVGKQGVVYRYVAVFLHPRFLILMIIRLGWLLGCRLGCRLGRWRLPVPFEITWLFQLPVFFVLVFRLYCDEIFERWGLWDVSFA